MLIFGTMNILLDIQKPFISALETKVPKLKLGKTLMGLLDQSKSVVYKKIRCEAPFSFSEIVFLARHFELSVDALIGQTLPEVAEQKPTVDYKIEFTPTIDSLAALQSFLTHTLGQFSVYKGLPDFNITYVARDIPLFENFRYPELGAFKALAWVHEAEQHNVRLKQVPQLLLDTGKQLFDLYKGIPSVEIWTTSTMDNTLQQITYCRSKGLLNAFEAQMLLDKLALLINDRLNEALAERTNTTGNKTLIVSPFIMMNNCFLGNLGSTEMAVVALNTIQSLVVHNTEFIHSIKKSISFQETFGINMNRESEENIREFFKGLSDKVKMQKDILK